ncbi:hypothetical protein RJT34_24048 [Clitoria ternatea]|uniref:Transmembrane protein n=1 Tax=Clitoria ternatea TaxID=43366 RepID=A0AAN9IH44_CLITE
MRTLLRSSLSIPPSFLSHYSLPSSSSSLSLKPQQHHQPFLSPKPQPLLLTFATNNNNNNNNSELKEKENTQQPPSNGQQQEEKANTGSKQRRPILSLNWNSIFDPDPDNVIALGLTGLLTWASVQLLCQLLFISFAILLAALKYSFIAALLLFILIALL